MKVITESVNISTNGYCDLKDLTSDVSQKLSQTGLKNGTVTLFVPGSTGGLTTIEYEPGLQEDFPELMERLIPSKKSYHHGATWGDANGFSHLRASLIGPSLTVPFSNSRLTLGTWQQIVFVDFDNRSRSRTLILQFMGE